MDIAAKSHLNEMQRRILDTGCSQMCKYRWWLQFIYNVQNNKKMKITINKPTEFETTWVDAGVRYWDDAKVNGV